MTDRVAIIGAGRMGQGIALALSRSGVEVSLLGRARKTVPSPLRVQTVDWASSCADARLVLIAVPDGAVGAVAERLRGEGKITPRHAVLHLSGLLARGALHALSATGAGLGSFHPLQSVADPATAPERFRNAYAGIEGDAIALEAGARLAALLGMTPVQIPESAKPAYHVGATLVANYSVALVGMAVRLARHAGVSAETAERMYLPLLRGAEENLARLGAAASLTGAISRGDTGTVKAHLAALGPGDRVLYAAVGLEALALAREAGLDADRAVELQALLSEAATA